ncbi:MAG: DegT/DnrJ/EryC1/StrS family aminotransferase [Xenococcaceae cyanobacterium]
MLSQIPFGNLKRQYEQLQEQIDTVTREVYQSGWFILGKQVEKFEANFAAYCGAKYSVGVGSGTEALHLALIACGIECGDEVITVANTCVPTISAISLAGAIPVFVDLNDKTFTIDPSQIEERITSKTKAIIPVHLYGQCADMNPILEIADRHGLAIVEDCAQASGSLYNGRMAGTIGHAGAFSFYPSKNLGAFGDGGMVTTNDEQIAQKLVKLRNYGQEKRYYHSIKGFNSRLDELQAAILNVKLPYLNAWNQRRREIARRYNEAFGQVQGIAPTSFICPQEALERFHIYHLYVVRVTQRDRFQSLLQEKGIGTIIHYPIPVHLQESYSEHRSQSKYLPVTEKLAGEIVSLPLYPELTDEEVDYIIGSVLNVDRKLNDRNYS